MQIDGLLGLLLRVARFLELGFRSIKLGLVDLDAFGEGEVRILLGDYGLLPFRLPLDRLLLLNARIAAEERLRSGILRCRALTTSRARVIVGASVQLVSHGNSPFRVV